LYPMGNKADTVLPISHGIPRPLAREELIMSYEGIVGLTSQREIRSYQQRDGGGSSSPPTSSSQDISLLSSRSRESYIQSRGLRLQATHRDDCSHHRLVDSLSDEDSLSYESDIEECHRFLFRPA